MSEPSSDPNEVEANPRATVLVLVRDLLFSSRISATARAQNVAAIVVRDPARLAQHGVAARLIVDLNLDGAIEAASEWMQRTRGHAVGFVAHTDAETIARARAAGIDQVLARSAFVERLRALLAAN